MDVKVVAERTPEAFESALNALPYHEFTEIKVTPYGTKGNQYTYSALANVDPEQDNEVTYRAALVIPEDLSAWHSTLDESFQIAFGKGVRVRNRLMFFVIARADNDALDASDGTKVPLATRHVISSVNTKEFEEKATNFLTQPDWSLEFVFVSPVTRDSRTLEYTLFLKYQEGSGGMQGYRVKAFPSHEYRSFDEYVTRYVQLSNEGWGQLTSMYAMFGKRPSMIMFLAKPPASS